METQKPIKLKGKMMTIPMDKPQNEIKTIADNALSLFLEKKRDNGETFYCLVMAKGGNPIDKDLSDAIYNAHDGMGPDDYVYENFKNALEFISQAAEYNDSETIDDIRDRVSEFTEAYTGIYNSELAAWLASNLNRAEYVNQAASDYGFNDHGFDLFDTIRLGQCFELESIFNHAASYVESKIEL